MDVDRSRIRPKSLVLLFNRDHTAHAVARFGASSENPLGFHRLVGGGIELGERSEDALRREVLEELGVEVDDVQRIAVLENLFHLDGEFGHEIVFLFTAQPQTPLSIPGEYVDNGIPMWVEWRPVEDSGQELPLYPEGTGDVVRNHVAALAGPTNS